MKINNLKLTQEKSNLQQIIISLLMTIGLLTVYNFNIKVLIPVVLIILLIVSIKNPLITLFVWINLLPYEFVFDEYSSSSVFKHLFIILFIVSIYSIITRYYLQNNKRLIIFLSISALSLIMSYVLNSKQSNLSNVFSTFSIYAMLILLVYLMIEYTKSLELFFIVSGLNTVILTLLHLIISTEKRLSSFKNVRVLSNYYGLVSILAIAILFTGQVNMEKKIYQNKKLLFVIFVLIFNLGSLSLTQSRGVVVALLMTVFVGIFLKLISSDVSAKDKKRMIQVILLTIVVLYVISLTPLFELLNGDVLIHRLKKKSSENVRWEVWSYALQSLTKTQWIFGAGPNSFHRLVQPKFDFYAHSIYIDHLVSVGLFGLLNLLAFLSTIFLRAFKDKKFTPILILVFMGISFFPHGSMNSKYFWIYVAIAYVATYQDTNKNTLRIAAENKPSLMNKFIIWFKFYFVMIFTKLLGLFNKDCIVETETGIKIFNKYVLSMDQYIVEVIEDVSPKKLYIGFDALNDTFTLTETLISDSPHYALMIHLKGDSTDNDNIYFNKSSFSCLDERSEQYYAKSRIDNMLQKFKKREIESKEKTPLVYVHCVEEKMYVIDGKHRVAQAILNDTHVDCVVISNEYIIDSFRNKLLNKMLQNIENYKINIEFYNKVKGSVHEKV